MSLLEKLHMLGYCSAWVESGFLSEAVLDEQVGAFRLGKDVNTEHHRYQTFRRVLQERATFADAEIASFVQLAQDDPDQSMAQAPLIDLYEHPGLTAVQRTKLRASEAFSTQRIRRKVAEYDLLEALRGGDRSRDLLDRAIQGGHKAVHLAMLEMPNMPRDVIERLVRCGATRAVRNMANVALKTGRHRGHDPDRAR